MNWSPQAAQWLRRYSLPLLSGVALVLACTDSNHRDGHLLATEFSGLIYKGFILLSLSLLLLLAWRRHSKAVARRTVEFTILTFLLTNVLKIVVRLPRPPHMHHGIRALHAGFSPGFPSAHTALAFGLAWMVFEIQPSLSSVWFAVAVAIGWSRIELYSHYPYQVICGALIGALVAWGISRYPRGVASSLLELRKTTAPNIP